MIIFRYAVGNGDREAPKITDDLIIDEEMAKCRAIQALCDFYKVNYSRTVRSTLDKSLELGQVRSIVVADPQFDAGLAVSVTTGLSSRGSYEDVIVEKYEDVGL